MTWSSFMCFPVLVTCVITVVLILGRPLSIRGSDAIEQIMKTGGKVGLLETNVHNVVGSVVRVMTASCKFVVVVQLINTFLSSVEPSQIGRWVIVRVVPIAELPIVSGGILVVIDVPSEYFRVVSISSRVIVVGDLSVGCGAALAKVAVGDELGQVFAGHVCRPRLYFVAVCLGPCEQSLRKWVPLFRKFGVRGAHPSRRFTDYSNNGKEHEQQSPTRHHESREEKRIQKKRQSMTFRPPLFLSV